MDDKTRDELLLAVGWWCLAHGYPSNSPQGTEAHARLIEKLARAQWPDTDSANELIEATEKAEC